MGKIRDYLLIGAFAITLGTGTYFYSDTKEFKNIKTYSSLTAEFIWKGGLAQLIHGKQHVHDWIKENIPDVEERLEKIQTEEEYHETWDKFWNCF